MNIHMNSALKDHIARWRFDRMRCRTKWVQAISPIQDTTQSAVTDIIEPLPSLELAGYRLEPQNQGAPRCSDIALNERMASWTKPQAWLEIINGQPHWFYNYPGACAEAEFLGKKIPTIDQWTEMLAMVPGSAEEKAQRLNIPLVGHRYPIGGKFSEPSFALLHSSSSKDEKNAYCITLEPGSKSARKNWGLYSRGLPLRLLSKEQ